MRRISFNALFFIKKTKLLKNGEASVCMRITVDGQRVETNIRKSVDPSSWNQAKECVRGVSIENVSKMLGHSNIKMTQHYAKVLDRSIMKDMRNVALVLSKKSLS